MKYNARAHSEANIGLELTYHKYISSSKPWCTVRNKTEDPSVEAGGNNKRRKFPKVQMTKKVKYALVEAALLCYIGFLSTNEEKTLCP